jgi:hypothetical protein
MVTRHNRHGPIAIPDRSMEAWLDDKIRFVTLTGLSVKRHGGRGVIHEGTDLMGSIQMLHIPRALRRVAHENEMDGQAIAHNPIPWSCC